MYRREIAKELEELTHHYPVVTVTGPRQSGRTTLVRGQFPLKAYINLVPYPEGNDVKSRKIVSQILTIDSKLISLNMSEKRSIKRWPLD